MKELRELRRLEERHQFGDSSSNSSSSMRLNTRHHKLFNSKSHTNGYTVNHHNSTQQQQQQQQQQYQNSGNNKSKQQTFNRLVNGSFSSKNAANGNNTTRMNDEISCENANEATSGGASRPNGGEETTWIHELFQGILVNETKCLNCETVDNKNKNKNNKTQ